MVHKPIPNSRRNLLIRAIVSLTGDVSIGVAISSACFWVIQSAALGWFLSFLAWLISVLLALAVSQHVLHPLVRYALSDAKLDSGLASIATFVEAVDLKRVLSPQDAWRLVGQAFGRFTVWRSHV